MVVEQAYGHGTLADGGGDAFDGSASDVADREEPGRLVSSRLGCGPLDAVSGPVST
jgi:hypothetical protein